jgi:hypothetical protein
MNEFVAEQLSGSCISSVVAGQAFPSISLHILYYTTETTAPVTNQTGLCDNKMILKHDAAGKNAVLYGSNDHSPEGFDFPISGIKFDLLDVSKWDAKVITPYSIPAYTVSFDGPRFREPNTYIRLTKRDQVANPFAGSDVVYWTDANDQTFGQDWLGNAIPGGWCFTNRGIPEPMLGTIYFEDAKKATDPPNEVDRSKTLINENWTPFCEALPVYNSNGSLIGSFDGLAWIAFFNTAVVKNPMEPPLDSTYIGPPPMPKLDPKRQILNLEIWIYLTKNSSDPSMKSPKIASLRYWTYTRNYGTGNFPFDPYLFFGAGAAVGGGVTIPINFNLLQNANNPESLQTHQASLSLSNLKFFIGA